MKRPNLEVRAMRAVYAMRAICLLAETLTATYLDDQCQRAGGVRTQPSSLATVALIDSRIDRRKSN